MAVGVHDVVSQGRRKYGAMPLAGAVEENVDLRGRLQGVLVYLPKG
jgi:hypothetical protein